MNPLKQAVHFAGRKYVDFLTRRAWEQQSDADGHSYPTERPVEYEFVFRAIRDLCPRTILDVGTGIAALPALLRSSGAFVDAIDQVQDYWGDGGENHNRHWHIQRHDIRNPLPKKYDMITCISVLEHIPDPDVPVANMLDALNPDGVLLLCGPYNEQTYVPNVYELPEAQYGKTNRYICQQYSRKELDRWVKPPFVIEEQEWWRVFDGPWWTMGRARPVRVSATELHQHSCVRIRRTGLTASRSVIRGRHGEEADVRGLAASPALAAAEQVEAAHAASPAPAALAEIVADKGYHSNQTLVDLEAGAVRSYIAEPDRGGRDWTKTPEAQAPVYGNRWRVRGERGQRLLRGRGEYVERSFAHMYDTGGLRRTHLRGHQNTLKRLLVHAGAFNLGILMRQAFGRGTPRGLQGRRFGLGALDIALGMFVERVWMATTRLWPTSRRLPGVVRPYSTVVFAWRRTPLPPQAARPPTV